MKNQRTLIEEIDAFVSLANELVMKDARTMYNLFELLKFNLIMRARTEKYINENDYDNINDTDTRYSFMMHDILTRAGYKPAKSLDAVWTK